MSKQLNVLMPKIDLGQLQLENKQSSQLLGRRLYRIHVNQKPYWLKLQALGIHELAEQYFENELEIYRELNRVESAKHSVLGNFAIIDPQQYIRSDEQFYSAGLLIEDANNLFAQNPQSISEKATVNILLKSLDVLQNLHQLGFIHGDLKKEHFRINTNSVFLIDFEQARTINGLIRPHLSATPRYMAPELFHAVEKSIRSDIYALGIIWLEWLTQNRLSCNSYKEWAILHCQLLKINLPEKFHVLYPIFEQILAKKIDQRFANICQIKQALSKNVQRKSNKSHF
ncbi:protein kinase [Acinetobacter gerneri]|uniref:Protein kinase n=1 Tax=Acinetobacter gerneri TaxID=202952 RepID=A0AAW8JPE4_9GAMM|nr:protein kinase [Acinetobacter gerneri]MDQ9010187.1 protein kinase [Acinetobacter gerneri]MDQ9014208.1 protein kinase [Acinetobacter gerneri]MDQ9025465.1 protein kinase [Acinetobacter gerneri]MDQ9052660.1 protein kinase [Acinetobacter gerneri]MDQ9060278.1 protein kinase [Acinetobacter gerneri]